MTHAEMIDRWPSLTDFAADLGVEYGTAKQMRRRDSIAARYWLGMEQAAKRRGIEGVTVITLAEAEAVRPTPAQPAEPAPAEEVTTA
jgi:hypothetical protein